MMRLISHNALQPLGTHSARSQLINIHEPSDEYVNDKKKLWCPGEQPQLANLRAPHALAVQGWKAGGKRHLRASKGTIVVLNIITV